LGPGRKIDPSNSLPGPCTVSVDHPLATNDSTHRPFVVGGALGFAFDAEEPAALVPTLRVFVPAELSLEMPRGRRPISIRVPILIFGRIRYGPTGIRAM
jgi:hypothetical protein